MTHEPTTASPQRAVPHRAVPERAAPERTVDVGKLGWGLVLVLIGGALLLERLDLFYVDEYLRYWPLLLMALGGVITAAAGTADKRRSGLWLLALGVWFLVNTLELWSFWYSDSWPLIIVFAGVINILQPKAGDSRLRGLLPLAIGGWLLVNTREIWGLEWEDSWPLLLIAIGAVMVVRAVAERAWPRSGGEGAPTGGGGEGGSALESGYAASGEGPSAAPGGRGEGGP